MLHDLLPLDRFLPLPEHAGQERKLRRTGVEIEFAGLSLPHVAELVQARWGGEITCEDVRDYRVRGGRLGEIKVELDISIKLRWAEDLAARSLGDLVPIEIVTPPLDPADLPECDHLMTELYRAGAQGTRARLAYGFGIHFNTEIPSRRGVVAIARAYALLEDWLRGSDPIDPARRILPFVDPWPGALRDALSQAERWEVADLAHAYGLHAPSRHYGLDLLPVLEHLCPVVIVAVPSAHLKGGRPTFHYRLPETRLDEAGWSLAYEWNRWCLIEHVATDGALLDALARGWRSHRAQITRTTAAWVQQVEALLQKAQIPGRMGLGSGNPA